MKRILITGSRDWDDYLAVYAALDSVAKSWKTEEITVVHGGAKGADTIAGTWTNLRGFQEEIHPADWDKHGRKAGFVRNAEMVDLGADICVAFIKNGSKGATMTAELSEKAGIPTAYVTFDES